MSEMLRREIPMGVVGFVIALMFFDYYIRTDITRGLADLVRNWAVIVTATAAGVGVLNAVLRSGDRIRKKQPYWYIEIWTLVVMVIVAVSGLIVTTGGFGTHPVFNWVMTNMYRPIDSSVYGMIIFDIAIAFYRTFRARTVDATILLVSAFIVMVRNAPITGGLMPWFIPIGDWVNNIPTGGASRAFIMVASIGLIGFAIRSMLGHESTTVGVVD